ncbi:MAG: group II intron reverse transcriptase/maturase, partial [Prevotella sp.]|nr:group II intron reverse transcriptase/maturase [Prevotella sp.]
KLFLKVNRDKTGTGSVCGKKFLGYSFYFDKDGKCQLRLHPKTIDKLKATLKKLTGRSNGMGYNQRKEALRLFIRGWVEYYKLARMKKTLETIDKWLRRRIRMCIWKSWKNPRTRIANLIKCGVPKWQAYKHGWVKGYWRASCMPDCTHAMSGHNLYRAGYRFLMDYYVLVS